MTKRAGVYKIVNSITNKIYIGSTHTEEVRKIISETHKGNKYRLGKKLTETQKRDISERQKISVINLTTGKIFSSLKEASEYYGVKRNGISMACNGAQKTCGGFEWKKLEGIEF